MKKKKRKKDGNVLSELSMRVEVSAKYVDQTGLSKVQSLAMHARASAGQRRCR